MFKKGLRWDIIAFIGIPGFISAVIGAILISYIHLIILIRIFGVFLIAYMILVVLKPQFRLLQSKINLLLGGALSGFFAGLFGMGGAIHGINMISFWVDCIYSIIFFGRFCAKLIV